MPRGRGGRGRGGKKVEDDVPLKESRPQVQRNDERKQREEEERKQKEAENAKRLAQEKVEKERRDAVQREREAAERKKREEEEVLALRLRLEEEDRLRRIEEDRRRLEEAAAIEFRRQEERKLAEQNAQKQKNEALIAARKKIEEARLARAKEEQARQEKLKLEIAQKEESERRMREVNELRVRQEIEQQEASLRAEEARLREMQETELLRREMESRGARYESSSSRSGESTQKPRDLKRKATVESSVLDDLIVRVYAKLDIPETGAGPVVPLLKVRDGVYRFGTRNIFVDPWENDCGIAVRMGANSFPFDEFVKKYHKTEVLKMKGMACLGGFMGAGYV